MFINTFKIIKITCYHFFVSNRVPIIPKKELIQGDNTLYTKKIMATENGTFSYKPTTSGTYTWNFRMKNSGMVAQPASVYYLDNLVASYPIPYTRIDCDKGPNASYRFGFNGKKNDMETLTQDFGFRIYNPGLGRFLSVDPLSSKFPKLSPYQFASNTPIMAIDLDGLEAKIAIAGSGVTNIHYSEGDISAFDERATKLKAQGLEKSQFIMELCF